MTACKARNHDTLSIYEKTWRYYQSTAACFSRKNAKGKDPDNSDLPKKDDEVLLAAEEEWQDSYSVLDYYGYEKDKDRNNKVYYKKVEVPNDYVNSLSRFYFGEEGDGLASEKFPFFEHPYLGHFDLEDAQKEAIRKAFEHSISFIIGPPGNGKTTTILNLAYCAIKNNRSIAVVSSNREALSNIFEEIFEGKDDDKGKELLDHYIPLGNQQAREDFIKAISEAKESSGVSEAERRWAETIRPYFNEKKCIEWSSKNDPIFITSTFHSLGRSFSTFEGRYAEENQMPTFDFVVIDECSQAPPHLGFIAMNMAKHLVLVGDELQLLPVLRDSDAIKLFDLGEQLDVPLDYRWGKGISFMSMWERRIGEKRREHTTFLNVHHRCPRQIIEFCDKRIYLPRLQEAGILGKDEAGAMMLEEPETLVPPIRIKWFEGDYTERPKGGGCYNKKQLEIFMREEWDGDYFKELFDEKHESYAVLAPFKKQIEILQKLLEDDDRFKQLRTSEIKHGESQYNPYQYKDKKASSEELETEILEGFHLLTIHKSQGKGFDHVVILPVEDGYWEYPWSQQFRLINVALSRSKKDVLIIMSSNLMEKQWQEKLVGRFHSPTERRLDCGDDKILNKEHKGEVNYAENGEQIVVLDSSADGRVRVDFVSERLQGKPKCMEYDDFRSGKMIHAKDQGYIRKLLNYLEEKYGILDLSGTGNSVFSEDSLYGLHQTEMLSVFDRRISQPNEREGSLERDRTPSGPEMVFGQMLAGIESVVNGRMRVYGPVLVKYVFKEDDNPGSENREFDFIICDNENRVLLAIEIDGGTHTSTQSSAQVQLRREDDADAVKDDIVKDNGGCVLCLDEVQDSVDEIELDGFTLLRVPALGSTFNEGYSIGSLLNKVQKWVRKDSAQPFYYRAESLSASFKGVFKETLSMMKEEGWISTENYSLKKWVCKDRGYQEKKFSFLAISHAGANKGLTYWWGPDLGSGVAFEKPCFALDIRKRQEACLKLGVSIKD